MSQGQQRDVVLEICSAYRCIRRDISQKDTQDHGRCCHSIAILSCFLFPCSRSCRVHATRERALPTHGLEEAGRMNQWNISSDSPSARAFSHLQCLGTRNPCARNMFTKGYYSTNRPALNCIRNALCRFASMILRRLCDGFQNPPMCTDKDGKVQTFVRWRHADLTA